MARSEWLLSKRSLLALLASAAFLAGQEKIDPAAWGESHGGQLVPEFTHGYECLFCHRNDIGPGWQKNRTLGRTGRLRTLPGSSTCSNSNRA